jgi:predicted secreted Zn-dependent protease
MRPRLSTSLLAVALAVSAARCPAFAADVKVLVRTQTYAVTGNSGVDLVKAMDRAGPRHGFMTRAIAQTSYTVDWDLRVTRVKDACRLVRAAPTLHVNYVFPQAHGLTPALAKRWERFLAGVHKHEKTHGRIATEMVQAAAHSASGVTLRQDLSCNRTKREARRRIDAAYAVYEARQVAFDRREHADGGKVERLVDALISGR